MIKSELKGIYKDLVRAGKNKEANEILKQIQGVGVTVEKTIVESKPVEVKEEVKTEAPAKEKVKKKEPEESLDKLTSIRGIGEETLKDIKRIYSSVEELKIALKEDKVPLRNNQVKSLLKYYKL